MAYAAPALLAIAVLSAAGVVAWSRFSPDRIRSELAEHGVLTSRVEDGIAAEAKTALDDEGLLKIVPLLVSLDPLRALNLSQTRVSKLEPLKGLTALQTLNLSQTRVSKLEPPALQTLNLFGTRGISSLEPLKGLTALQTLRLQRTPVSSLEPLKGLTALQTLNVSQTQISSLEPLKGLTSLQTLDLLYTQVSSLEPVYGLQHLQISGISKDLQTDFLRHRR